VLFRYPGEKGIKSIRIDVVLCHSSKGRGRVDLKELLKEGGGERGSVETVDYERQKGRTLSETVSCGPQALEKDSSGDPFRGDSTTRCQDRKVTAKGGAPHFVIRGGVDLLSAGRAGRADGEKGRGSFPVRRFPG